MSSTPMSADTTNGASGPAPVPTRYEASAAADRFMAEVKHVVVSP